MKKIEEILKIAEAVKKPALVEFIGDEHDYSIFDEEAAGCGQCAMCDEVPRDACTHHGTAHRAEFYSGELYLAYFAEALPGFVAVAVRNNDDELVFPRDLKDFRVLEDRFGVLNP